MKLIFTTKRLPRPAAAALAPALLHDPLLNNCDSVGADCVTLRSSWSVYCKPRRRLRTAKVPLDCKPCPLGRTLNRAGVGSGDASAEFGVQVRRTGSAKYCEVIAQFRAARVPNPTTSRTCGPRKASMCQHGCTSAELAALTGFEIAVLTR